MKINIFKKSTSFILAVIMTLTPVLTNLPEKAYAVSLENQVRTFDELMYYTNDDSTKEINLMADIEITSSIIAYLDEDLQDSRILENKTLNGNGFKFIIEELSSRDFGLNGIFTQIIKSELNDIVIDIKGDYALGCLPIVYSCELDSKAGVLAQEILGSEINNLAIVQPKEKAIYYNNNMQGNSYHKGKESIYQVGIIAGITNSSTYNGVYVDANLIAGGEIWIGAYPNNVFNSIGGFFGAVRDDKVNNEIGAGGKTTVTNFYFNGKIKGHSYAPAPLKWYSAWSVPVRIGGVTGCIGDMLGRTYNSDSKPLILKNGMLNGIFNLILLPYISGENNIYHNGEIQSKLPFDYNMDDSSYTHQITGYTQNENKGCSEVENVYGKIKAGSSVNAPNDGNLTKNQTITIPLNENWYVDENNTHYLKWVVDTINEDIQINNKGDYKFDIISQNAQYSKKINEKNIWDISAEFPVKGVKGEISESDLQLTVTTDTPIIDSVKYKNRVVTAETEEIVASPSIPDNENNESNNGDNTGSGDPINPDPTETEIVEIKGELIVPKVIVKGINVNETNSPITWKVTSNDKSIISENLDGSVTIKALANDTIQFIASTKDGKIADTVTYGVGNIGGTLIVTNPGVEYESTEKETYTIKNVSDGKFLQYSTGENVPNHGDVWTTLEDISFLTDDLDKSIWVREGVNPNNSDDVTNYIAGKPKKVTINTETGTLSYLLDTLSDARFLQQCEPEVEIVDTNHISNSFENGEYIISIDLQKLLKEKLSKKENEDYYDRQLYDKRKKSGDITITIATNNSYGIKTNDGFKETIAYTVNEIEPPTISSHFLADSQYKIKLTAPEGADAGDKIFYRMGDSGNFLQFPITDVSKEKDVTLEFSPDSKTVTVYAYFQKEDDETGRTEESPIVDKTFNRSNFQQSKMPTINVEGVPFDSTKFYEVGNSIEFMLQSPAINSNVKYRFGSSAVMEEYNGTLKIPSGSDFYSLTYSYTDPYTLLVSEKTITLNIKKKLTSNTGSLIATNISTGTGIDNGKKLKLSFDDKIFPILNSAFDNKFSAVTYVDNTVDNNYENPKIIGEPIVGERYISYEITEGGASNKPIIYYYLSELDDTPEKGKLSTSYTYATREIKRMNDGTYEITYTNPQEITLSHPDVPEGKKLYLHAYIKSSNENIMNDSEIGRFEYRIFEKAAIPTASLDTEVGIKRGDVLYFTTEVPNCDVYYTKDGSAINPDEYINSLLEDGTLSEDYTGSTLKYDTNGIIMDFPERMGTMTIYAMVRSSDYSDSLSARFDYNLIEAQPPQSIPTTSMDEIAIVPPGTPIMLMSKTVGAKICYTTDSTVPQIDENGFPVGTTKIFGKETEDEKLVMPSISGEFFTIRASTIADDFASSEVIQLIYQPPAQVQSVFTSVSDRTPVVKGTEVSFSCSTEDARIFYRLNTSDEPLTAANGILYNPEVPFVIDKETTIELIAEKEAVISKPVIYTYKVADQLKKPILSAESGSVLFQGAVIKIASDKNGEVIYTLNGDDPRTAKSTDLFYGDSLVLNGESGSSVTVKAYCNAQGSTPSETVTYTYTICNKDEYLMLNKETGSSLYNGEQITISTSITNGRIEYTTANGSITNKGDTSVTLYANALPGSTFTIKASVNVEGISGSPTQIFTYNMANKTPVPTANIPSGAITLEGAVVTLISATNGDIFYTTDGSDPNTSSAFYQGPIAVDKTMVLKAIAVSEGSETSEIATYTYTRAGDVSPVQFSKPSGAIEQNSTISLTSSTEDARIYYSTNGTDPTQENLGDLMIYNSPITISRAVTIKAIAVKTGLHTSPSTSSIYTVIEPSLPTIGEVDVEIPQITSSDRLASRRTYSSETGGSTYSDVVLADEDLKVIISAEDGVIEKGVKLYVEDITPSNAQRDSVDISLNCDIVDMFEVNFEIDAERVSPQGTFEIGLPITSDYQNGLITVCRINSDNTIDTFETRRSGGIAYTLVDKSGIYAIAAPKVDEEKGTFWSFLGGIFNWFGNLF